MAYDLEYPGFPGSPDWDGLYRARGEEVMRHRPIFTGDVFEKVDAQSLGEKKNTSVIVLQHPCALRSNGVDLVPRLLVAGVRRHRSLSAEQWTTGYLSKMPLTMLHPELTSGKQNQAALFDELYLVGPEDLDPAKRVACLSQTGVNLLLQRWVHHNSRAVVGTTKYQEVSSPAYDEADLIEEWAEERLEGGFDVRAATTEAMEWLRGSDDGGSTRQKMLDDPQKRSTVRKQMRAALKELK